MQSVSRNMGIVKKHSKHQPPTLIDRMFCRSETLVQAVGSAGNWQGGEQTNSERESDDAAKQFVEEESPNTESVAAQVLASIQLDNISEMETFPKKWWTPTNLENHHVTSFREVIAFFFFNVNFAQWYGWCKKSGRTNS